MDLEISSPSDSFAKASISATGGLSPQAKRRATFERKIRQRNAALRVARVRNNIDATDIIAKNYNISSVQTQIIKALFQPNPNLTAIAKECGISVRNIHTWARILGIDGKGRQQSPHNKLPPEIKDQICKDLEQVNPSITAIAERHGVARNSVGSIAKELGVSGVGDLHPARNAIDRALEANPNLDAPELAERLGVPKAFVKRIQKKKLSQEQEKHKAILAALPTDMAVDYDRLLSLVQQQRFKDFKALQTACGNGHEVAIRMDSADFTKLQTLLRHIYPGRWHIKLKRLAGPDRGEWPKATPN